MCDEQVRRIIRTWMVEYLGEESEQLPRPGAVCPFAKPALEAGTIEIRTVSVSGPRPDQALLEEARRALGEFEETVAVGGPAARGALVIAVPELLDAGHVIDDVHLKVKCEAVNAGLMIGQFHADCTEPSARNPLFAVNRSPIPMLVIRAMTVHDILFLHQGAGWFHAYEERFGYLYEGSRRIDPTFRELFEAASARGRETISVPANV